MKYAILFLSLSITVNLIGQSQKSKKPKYFLKLQGGFLYDGHQNNSYKGFSLINLGWVKHQNNVLQGFDLELIKYNSDVQRKEGSRRGYGWNRDKISAELSYFWSYRMFGTLKNGLFAGGFGSLIWSTDFFLPSSNSRYKYEERSKCLGLGLKLDYVFQLKKLIYLNVSTKLTLFNTGLTEEQRFSPFSPLKFQNDKKFVADFLKNQFPLIIGLQFRL